MDLLLAIAIIAILFPVFGRERENARRASCQSNLKQIGLAVEQYKQDYDSCYPIGEIYPFGNPAEACAKTYLPGAPMFSSPYQQPMWMGIIFAYTKSSQLYYCPSGPNDSEAAEWKNFSAQPQRFGYSYNPNVLLQAQWEAGSTINTDCTVIASNEAKAAPSMLETRQTNPAQVAMLCDRATIERGAMVLDAAPGILNIGFGGRDDVNSAYGYSPSKRHLGGSNFLFVDGHVKFLSFDEYLAQWWHRLSQTHRRYHRVSRQSRLLHDARPASLRRAA